MTMDLTLVSHPLCPYVQRAAIALAEKGVPFTRRTVDLAAKPDWFLAVSPLGKTPVLLAEGTAIFESAVILEYLEETAPHPMHPATPLARARARGWIEVSSAILNDIAGLYNAPDHATLTAKATTLRTRFATVEAELRGPFFAGTAFSLVDAAFAPVFHYFDAFDTVGGFGILDAMPRIAAWRAALAARPSVAGAAPDDYQERLRAFLAARQGPMGTLFKGAA